MMELLLLEGTRSGPPVLVSQLAPTSLDPVAAALLEAAPPGRRRVLPGPGPDASTPVVRDWHRDAWIAMPASERESVAVVAGPGVASLAPLVEGAKVVATMREPLEAVSALASDGKALPNRRALAALRDERGRLPKAQMRLFSNPQARTLLLATAAPDLPVTLGPPEDADRWRRLLFEEAMPRVQPIFVDGLSDVAADLAAQLGYPPGHRARAGEIAGRIEVQDERPSIDPDRAELIEELNWLDQELFIRYRSTPE